MMDNKLNEIKSYYWDFLLKKYYSFEEDSVPSKLNTTESQEQQIYSKEITNSNIKVVNNK